jgi:hypothetical protein
MIDPSLLLLKTKARKTLELVMKLRDDGYKFYLPNSFWDFLSTMNARSWDGSFAKFYGTFQGGKFDLANLARDHQRLFANFELTVAHRDRHYEFFESLPLQLSRKEREDRYLLNTLLEEWVFLQEHSWIVSRVKRPFNRFIDAGSNCLHLGRHFVDTLERRTLHKDRNHPLSNLSHLRAFGKWLAIGGDSVLFLFQPVEAFLGGFAIKGFMLLDPVHPS